VYLKDFILQPKLTGSIVPSSPYLAETYAALADLPRRKCVVEIGPGNGCLTKTILSALSEEATYFAIEINPDFVRRFKKNLPEATIYEDSLINLPDYLRQNSVRTCDCIISGIPWSNFGAIEQEDYMQVMYDSLEKGGCFLTMAYFHSPATRRGGSYKQLITKMFDSVIVSPLVLKNVPPAYVYVCVK